MWHLYPHYVKFTAPLCILDSREMSFSFVLPSRWCVWLWSDRPHPWKLLPCRLINVSSSPKKSRHPFQNGNIEINNIAIPDTSSLTTEWPERAWYNLGPVPGTEDKVCKHLPNLRDHLTSDGHTVYSHRMSSTQILMVWKWPPHLYPPLSATCVFGLCHWPGGVD